MSDFTKGRQTRTKGVEVGTAFVGGDECEFIFGQGTQLFPNIPVPIYGACGTRMVLEGNQRWFEFSFRMDHLLSGNASAGWTDAGNYFRIEPEWSQDLVNWSMGKFIPAAVPVVDLGAGVYEYWARAINPQDSAVKTAALVASNIGGDARNNGFTALVIAGVSIALPHFPYNMAVAGTAAQLQADLIAAGFGGSIVTGTTATNWTVSIPGITYSAFGVTSYFVFPTYLVADMFGVLNTPVSQAYFGGNFVNAAGVAILLKVFARLKITAGTRYDPYH